MLHPKNQLINSTSIIDSRQCSSWGYILEHILQMSPIHRPPPPPPQQKKPEGNVVRNPET